MATGDEASASRRDGGGFLRWVELTDGDMDTSSYPFTLPIVAGLRAAGRLELDAAVTFLAGDNGTGKSTLIEAIAVAAGFNPEGGSTNFRFSTRATESSLGEHLRLVRGIGKPRSGFFLRAESFYNVATEIDRLGVADGYGGISLHERSHGESFLDLATHRFKPRGLYLLDEPEAALSVHGCLALLTRIHDLVQAGSQFIIATHSPILLAVPHARILQIEGSGTISHVDYDDAQPVLLTRSFLASPQRYLHHLFNDDS
ncbi:Predicted ATPase [Micromonospora coriariae]|uniref:Predicted ATPase n=2 Tax=Micromonospora coriariae TaxID=285665 RepID=A0A1C4X893_9ACTN|nr:AAA family ATPase [Micromonospora coriariae]SCF04587.1 Predicted ATPase [Micromonospora coriariae]